MPKPPRRGEPAFLPLDDRGVMEALGFRRKGPDVHVPVPLDLFPEHPNLAIWQVTGDSMTGDGIHAGDLVLLDKTRIPGAGEITVVFVNGTSTDGEPCSGRTLKRVRRGDDGSPVLVPSNPAYPPIVLTLDSSTLSLGVAVGVITTLPDGRRLARRLDDGRAVEYAAQDGREPARGTGTR